MLEFTKTKYGRGLVSLGNMADLTQFQSKIAKHQPITYAAIGGSITAGAGAIPANERAYAPLFAKWLNGKTACRFVNAGIGATTSMYGAFRAQRDILCHQPDIITIEFAVNDKVNPDTAASFEWLVRQCAMQPQSPLIILIFTMFRDGSNFQHIHIPIGNHYQLPMLSYRDAVYPDIEQGNITWSDISNDEVHPNNAGHAFIGEMLKTYVASPVKPDDTVVRKATKWFCPTAKLYEGGEIVTPAQMRVIANHNWQIIAHEHAEPCYHAEIPEAAMILQATGKQFVIGCEKYAGEFGQVEVTVDDNEPVIIDGFYEKPEVQQWAGGHTVLTILAKGLPDAEHTLKINLLPEKHPKSNGYNFNIRYLLVN